MGGQGYAYLAVLLGREPVKASFKIQARDRIVAVDGVTGRVIGRKEVALVIAYCGIEPRAVRRQVTFPGRASRAGYLDGIGPAFLYRPVQVAGFSVIQSSITRTSQHNVVGIQKLEGYISGLQTRCQSYRYPLTCSEIQGILSDC